MSTEGGPEDPFAKRPPPQSPRQPSSEPSPSERSPSERSPSERSPSEPSPSERSPSEPPPSERSPSEPPQYPSPEPPGPESREPYGGAASGAGPDLPAGTPPLADRGRRLVARIVDAFIVGIPVYAVTGAIWNTYTYRYPGGIFAQSVVYALVYLMYQVFIGVLLRGYPVLQGGEETKLLRSRAGRAGSPSGGTGVHPQPPALRHKLMG